MTQLLEEVFDRALALPEQDQNHLANLILEWMEDAQKWDEAFAQSADALSVLADEALEEFSAGKTEVRDPDTL